MDGWMGNFPVVMILPIMLHEHLCSLPLSARGTTAKHRRLGGLNSRNLFATVLEAGKLEVRAPTDAAPGESPLRNSLQTPAFPQCLRTG